MKHICYQRNMPDIAFDACEITDATFDDPHPNPDHFEGVTYDPVKRQAKVGEPKEGFHYCAVGEIGDWICNYPTRDGLRIMKKEFFEKGIEVAW